MKVKHINNCTNYFGLGKIENFVAAESFSWEENEDIEFLLVLNYIEINSSKKYVYLTTSRICQYPLTTLDKYWGLLE